MKKNTKLDWSKTTNEFFWKLKQTFVTVSLLIQFNNTKETVLETTASIRGIVGTLFQYIDGIFRFCALLFIKKLAGRNQLRNL